MDNYKLTIAYDGTDFHGWQQQNNASSIQPVIKGVIETIVRHEIRLIGSGRTDAGVHALGQVAHFHTHEDIDLGKFLYSANSLLPPTIRLLSIEKADPTFHSQHSVTSKTYHYHLFLDPIMNPMKRLYTWKPPYEIDLSRITKAAPLFVGTHDFTTFTNKGSSSEDPVRTLYSLTVQKEKGGCCLIFCGNGFLYKMVRNITGTLAAIGSGRLQPEDVPILLAQRDRRKAPEGAPPTGLFLAEVHYQ